MYLFLSFGIAILSLYYLGMMADSYNSDTTYLTPLIILLIYSILTIFREVKKDNDNFQHYNQYNQYNSYGYGGSYRSNTNSQNNSYIHYGGTHYQSNDRVVENFAPNKTKEKDNEKELTHYPSSNEIREKIKELEKSRWFRIKRDAASLFGIDITEKYKKPYKVNNVCKVTKISGGVNKEDHNRFAPNNNFYIDREKSEYNEVTKLMKNRSCEISLNDSLPENIE